MQSKRNWLVTHRKDRVADFWHFEPTVIDVLYAIVGILSKDDDDDDNENGKKTEGLDK